MLTMNTSNTNNNQEVDTFAAHVHTVRDMKLSIVAASVLVNMYFFITWLVITYGADMRLVVTP